MDDDGRGAAQPSAGFGQTEHSVLTPVGQIEQATLIAAGLKQSRRGWRKVVAVAGLVVIGVAVVAVIVAGMLSTAGR